MKRFTSTRLAIMAAGFVLLAISIGLLTKPKTGPLSYVTEAASLFNTNQINWAAQTGCGTATYPWVPADSQCEAPGGGGGTDVARTMIVPNDCGGSCGGGGGTAANLMAAWDVQSYSQHWVDTQPAAASGVDAPLSLVGVCISGCGTGSGNVTVQYEGNVSWICDNSTTVGHQIVESTTTAGECHDTGGQYPGENPNGASILGTVTTANTGSGTASVVNLKPIYTWTPNYQTDAGWLGTFTGSYLRVTGGFGSNLGDSMSLCSVAPSTTAGGGAYALYCPGMFFWPNSGTNGPSAYLGTEHGCGSFPSDTVYDTTFCNTQSPSGAAFGWYGMQYQNPESQTLTGGGFSVPSGFSGWQPARASNLHYWTMAGNATVPTITNDRIGDRQEIWLYADPSTTYTITWPTNWRNCPVAPTAGAGVYLVVQERYDGTYWNCY